MRLFDPKLKNNILSYILQSCLAMLIIFIVLLLVERISSLTVIASLGASTFIAFSMPHAKASQPRYFIGGYIIGAICGILMNYVNILLVSDGITIFGHSPHIVTCAAAVALSMLIMTLFSFEHPTAAALAMGLVLEENLFITVLIAIVSILIITIIKYIIKDRIRNIL